MAIALMILVNNAGSWQHVYPPLLPAPWHGFTPTTLIFPPFLFICGVAMAFSFAKYTHSPSSPPAAVYVKILRRAAILFALGLFLNASILVGISLAYLFAAVAILKLSPRRLGFLCLAILLGYWLALTQIPLPGYGAGDLSPNGADTLVAYLDRLILTPLIFWAMAALNPRDC